MSTISASTTSTTAYKVTADTTGTLVLQTGSTPTTAVTIGTDQSVTTAGTINSLTVGRGAGSVATNTAVGASALATNSTGAGCTAIGYTAANVSTGDDITAVGTAAALLTTTGNNLVAVGTSALRSNTSGAFNTALGRDALRLNTTANSNTAVGYKAGYSQTTGGTYGSNTFIGSEAGRDSTTGDINTFVGAGSGYLVTTGARNTILGAYSGNQGGLDIRTASNYIVLSDGAGNPRGIFNASGGFYIGSVTTIGSGTAALSVAGGGGVVCGFQSTGGSTNECTLNWNTATTGNNLFSSFLTEASGTVRGTIDYNRGAGLVRYNTTSDATLKNIIGDADGAKSVDILKSTRIREYSWKDDQTNKPQIGVIAQELHETFSGAVSVGGDKVEVDEEGNETTRYIPWAVDKTAFTFHLVAGWQAHEKIIQEQQAIIETLTNRITALEAK